MEITVDRIYNFHHNDEQSGPVEQPTEVTLEIPINTKMLNDILDDRCYNDARCEAASWKKVGWRRLADFSPGYIKYSDVLKCMRCQKLMLRHVVKE